MKQLWILALAPLLVTAASSASELAWPDEAFAPSAEVPFDPQLELGTFENGLRWFVRANAEPRDRAELRLVLRAGSLLEDEDQRGLAHFLEHMAFNGTENYPEQALIDFLEGIGMKFGPEINAYTSFDETVYMLTVPTDDPALLHEGLRVLAEWSRRIALDPEEVVKERGVVLEEWRLRRGGRQRVQDKQLPVLFHESRYAERLPIGLPEVIQSADPERLARFYHDWYRPDLMAVIAVGDFDPAQVRAWIAEEFDVAWGPVAAAARPRVDFEVPAHAGTFVSIESDPEITSNFAQITVKKPVARVERVGDYRHALAEDLFDGMFNARLRELLEQEDPPFVFARARGGGLTRTRDSITLSTSAKDGGLPRALETVLIEAKRVREHGFTPTELERRKAEVLRSVRKAYTEREKTESAAFAGAYVQHVTDEAKVPGVEFRWELYQRLLPEIALDEVNALIAERDFLVEADRVILVSTPEKEGVEVPTEEQIRAVTAAVDAAVVEPYEDEVREEELLPELPEPGAVVATETDEALGLTVWTLSNGMRVLVKPTDFKEDEFSLQGFSQGGRSLGAVERDLSQDFASTLVNLGGLGEFDAIQLQKKLAGRRVSVTPWIGTFEEGVRGGGSPEDLELALQIVHLYFTQPRRDEVAVASMKARYEAMLRNRSSNPDAVYSDTLSVTLGNGHPWAVPLQAEDLATVDLDRGLDFYRQRFADAGEWSWVIVGNVELETLRPWVERYLASLPDRPGVERWRDTDQRPPAGPIHKVVRAGTEPKARTTIVMHADAEWTRKERHIVSSFGQALAIRLREILREDLGGTYGVRAFANVEAWPIPQAQMQIAFGADPERLDELVDQVVATLAEVRERGFEPSYLAKIKEQQKREYQEGQRENGYWSSSIGFRERFGIPQEEMLETLEVIESLSSEDLLTAAKKVIDLEGLIRVDLRPAE